MTGKEFLCQYILIDRQIRSVRLQLDDIKKAAEKNQMIDDFQPEIDELSDKLKRLISKSVIVKGTILDKILTIENNECREILIKKYIDEKSVAQISREMFMTTQGVRYHLKVGETKIASLIEKSADMI